VTARDFKSMAEKVIVALDTSSLEVAEKLLKKLQGIISFYKVGFELFTAHAWDAVELVRKYDGRVFLDLKLHDIPNTVSKTMAVLCEYDVDMVTLHTWGGLEMMKKSRQVADQRMALGKKRPVMLGVTVLTSHAEKDLAEELGVRRTLVEQVTALADLAKAAGLDGIVSSPHETEVLRSRFPKPFVIVTPGVRPSGAAHGDQKRVFTPDIAIQAGASYLVVGRPITGSEDPRKAAESIVDSMC